MMILALRRSVIILFSKEELRVTYPFRRTAIILPGICRRLVGQLRSAAKDLQCARPVASD
ncbi:hypothetical protein CIT26_24260 [Mesorhizobium temperatum]|uniref:Uncharacterized protein n=1 Tax=Mesorhizobium temperatum TaxID=241416 RepID=A0A271LF12_9HYPH|nr:hypothetical protein CIT26_24260 [Mesorhizobium temperatum]